MKQIFVFWVFFFCLGPAVVHAVCTVPGTHASLQGALNDVSCENIEVNGGVHYINVAVGYHLRTLKGLSNPIIRKSSGTTGYAGLEDQILELVSPVDPVLVEGFTFDGENQPIHGIEAQFVVHLTIKDCEFKNFKKSAVELFNVQFSISSSTFDRNRGNSSLGGALNLQVSLGSIIDTIFTDNRAMDGGAIYGNDLLALSIINSRFERNKATSRGGAIIMSLDFDDQVRDDLEVQIIGSEFISNSADDKGAALFYADLDRMTITSSQFSNNQSPHDGAIQLANNSGKVVISRSSFTVNYGGGAGAIDVDTFHAPQIWSSTFSGNHGPLGVVHANDDSSGIIELVHNTIHENDVGISLSAVGTQYLIKNSIVSKNTVNCTPAAWSRISSAGNNLDSLNQCNFIGASDVVSTDPLLTPLALNGGSTLNHLPEALSPVIDAGENSWCLSHDQRANPGLMGSACDMGSVEQ